MKILLLCALCILLPVRADELLDHPYRSFDGKTFIDLRNSLPREWFELAGHVTSVGDGPKDGALLILVDKGESTPGVAGGDAARIVHLTNYPYAHAVVDGTYLHCYARLAGRHQYRTVQGATATVLSYDFGQPATAQQRAAFDRHNLTNYLRAVEGVRTARSNAAAARVSRQSTNYSITPRPPP